MTYCLGLLLRDGLVMMSDSRTNAGVDNISTYRKMVTWSRPDDRVIVMMSAGNLAITQAATQLLDEGRREPDGTRLSLKNVTSMTEAARLVGWSLREVERIDGHALRASGVGFSASFLIGGQLRGRKMRLFQVYSEGNFIQTSEETPFLQIGEHKYGKPIIDRVVAFGTPLTTACKSALLSMDATIKSNLTVAAPIDLLVCRRDAIAVDSHHLLGDDDPYWNDLRSRWAGALERTFQELPDPPW